MDHVCIGIPATWCSRTNDTNGFKWLDFCKAIGKCACVEVYKVFSGCWYCYVCTSCNTCACRKVCTSPVDGPVFICSEFDFTYNQVNKTLPYCWVIGISCKVSIGIPATWCSRTDYPNRLKINCLLKSIRACTFVKCYGIFSCTGNWNVRSVLGTNSCWKVCGSPVNIPTVVLSEFNLSCCQFNFNKILVAVCLINVHCCFIVPASGCCRPDNADV